MNEHGSQRETYSVAEVAVILGIGRNQAYEAARRDDFPSIKLGGRILVPRTRFHRWLEETGNTHESSDA